MIGIPEEMLIARINHHMFDAKYASCHVEACRKASTDACGGAVAPPTRVQACRKVNRYTPASSHSTARPSAGCHSEHSVQKLAFTVTVLIFVTSLSDGNVSSVQSYMCYLNVTSGSYRVASTGESTPDAGHLMQG